MWKFSAFWHIHFHMVLNGFWHISRRKCNSKRYMHPFVHSSTVYNSQVIETINVHLWIKDVVYTHTQEYYSAIKKNEIMPFVTLWMGLEIILLSEISQKEKDNCRITHVQPKIWQMNLSTKQKQTHRGQTCDCQGGKVMGERRNGNSESAETNDYI